MSLISKIDVLDGIAKYFVCLADARSYWYSLNSSIDDEFHLAHRFGLDEDEYHALLIAADLARVKGGKIIISSARWIDFRGHHRFADTDTTDIIVPRSTDKRSSTPTPMIMPIFEVVDKTITINGVRKVVWVVRIGKRGETSNLDFGSQMKCHESPPRMSRSLLVHQQAFLSSTAAAVVRAKITVENLGGEDSDEEDSDEEESDTTTVVANTHPQSVTTTAVANTHPQLSTSNNNNLATLQFTSPFRRSSTSTHATISPDIDATTRSSTYLVGQQYPTLAAVFGKDFDPFNATIQQTMRQMLSEITHILDGSKEGLNVPDYWGRDLSFVRVPKAGSDKSFYNSKSWIDDALKINGSPHNGTFESAFRVSKHLCRFYKEPFVAALRKEGMEIANPMSTTQFVAMLSALQITGQKEKVLAKYLRQYLGKGFCPSQRGMSILGEGHAEVFTNSIEWEYEAGKRKEKVEWMEKNVHSEIEIQLTRALNSRSLLQPSNVYEVQVVLGGDFGDKAFHFVAEVTAFLNDGSEPVYFEFIVSELICKSESAPLLEATIVPRLKEGLKLITDKRLQIKSTDDGMLVCSFVTAAVLYPMTSSTSDSKQILVDIYIIGDLKFQAALFGRAGMSGHHCMWCKLKRKEFQKIDHKDGEPWTFSDLLATAERVAGSSRGVKSIDGVKKDPWWPFLLFKHHIAPLLHINIGIGNNLLDRFCNVINVFIEKLSSAELQEIRTLQNYERIIDETVKERDAFDLSTDGKTLTSLQGKINRRRKISAPSTRGDNGYGNTGNDGGESEDDHDDHDDDDDDDNGNDAPLQCPSNSMSLDEQISHLELELKPLLEKRNQMVEVLETTRKLATKLQIKIRDRQKEKAKTSQSLETQIFEVLKRQAGVELAAYHGGSLNGKDIRKVMNDATELFSEFSTILKAGKRDDCELSDDAIDALCRNFRLVFVLWDGAMSYARKHNPTPEDVTKYRRYVNAAVDGHVKLGLSITPKVHLMYKHVEQQMTEIKRGLGDKTEDGIERSHQTGKRSRSQFGRVTNIQIRANAIQRMQFRNSDPEVIQQKQKVEEGSRRKFKQDRHDRKYAAEIREEERMKNRERALEEYEMDIENDNGCALTFLSRLLSSSAAETTEESPPSSTGET